MAKIFPCSAPARSLLCYLSMPGESVCMWAHCVAHSTSCLTQCIWTLWNSPTRGIYSCYHEFLGTVLHGRGSKHFHWFLYCACLNVLIYLLHWSYFYFMLLLFSTYLYSSPGYEMGILKPLQTGKQRVSELHQKNRFLSAFPLPWTEFPCLHPAPLQSLPSRALCFCYVFSQPP